MNTRKGCLTSSQQRQMLRVTLMKRMFEIAGDFFFFTVKILFDLVCFELPHEPLVQHDVFPEKTTSQCTLYGKPWTIIPISKEIACMEALGLPQSIGPHI